MFDDFERSPHTIETLINALARWGVSTRSTKAAFNDDLDALAAITHAIHFAHIAPDLKNPYRSRVDELLGSFGGRLVEKRLDEWGVPYPPLKKSKFHFIDLFAGIGGMRLAFQDPKIGGACVYSSEWDQHARHTYFANFGEIPFGDITLAENADLIPKHEILVAGFPCQAFSIAGKRKGFEDTRGTLFFHVAETLDRHRPKAFLLENVKGLMSHKSGATLERILEVLREDLGYHVPDPRILNARDFGVPQNRERIFIVGFANKSALKRFKFPKPLPESQRRAIRDIKETQPVPSRYYLSTQYLKTLREHRQRHEDAGNGFGFEIIADDAIANAIVVGGMGRERNLVYDHRLQDFTPQTNIKGEINREGIRKMTPAEWARLQGFDPPKYRIPVADAQAYKQFGNSVAVPVIRALAHEITTALDLR